MEKYRKPNRAAIEQVATDQNISVNRFSCSKNAKSGKDPFGKTLTVPTPVSINLLLPSAKVNF